MLKTSSRHVLKTNKCLLGIDVCRTRWLEGDVSYESFYLALLLIVEAFEVINGTHKELGEFEEIYTKGWDAKSKVEANQFLNSLAKFEVAIGMIALYRLLHPVGITRRSFRDTQLMLSMHAKM